MELLAALAMGHLELKSAGSHKLTEFEEPGFIWDG